MNLSKIADKSRPDHLQRRIAALEKQVAQLQTARTIQDISVAAVRPAVFKGEGDALNASATDRAIVSGTLTVPDGFSQALVVAIATAYASTKSTGTGTDISSFVQIAGDNGMRSWGTCATVNGFAGVTSAHARVVTGLLGGGSVSVVAFDAEDATGNVITGGVFGTLVAVALFLR